MALKRTHPSSSQDLDVPELPKLGGDTLLQVFTHKSLRRADQEPFDNQRLSLLGERILHLLVIDSLMSQRPMLTLSEIIVIVDSTCEQIPPISPLLHKDAAESLSFFKQHHSLGSSIRSTRSCPGTACLRLHFRTLTVLRTQCHPDQLSTILNAPEEASSILHAYVGGTYVDHGDEPLQKVVQTWLHYSLASYTPPPKKIKMETEVCEMELDSPAVSPPAGSQRPNPRAPAQPNLPFLPLFNQTALQRGVTLDYPGTYDHAQNKWVVQCVVDGIAKGTGSGATKNVAQELAARQAYDTMGWV